jgi:hypothetical protein
LMSPELCSIVAYVRTYSSTACFPAQPELGGASIPATIGLRPKGDLQMHEDARPGEMGE